MTIIEQWRAMLERGIIPALEYELANGEYLTVDISIATYGNGRAKAIIFDFDRDGLPTYFSGEVSLENWHYSGWHIMIDQYTTSLDSLLEQIDQEIREGFLIPNDLEAQQ